MQTLDFTLPTVGAARRDDHENITDSGAANRDGEAFDHLMTRALSPAGDAASAGKKRTLAAASEGQPRKISSHPEPAKARARNAANEVAASVAGETSAAGLPSADKMADPKVSDREPADDVASENETQISAAGLPGVIIPLLAALPTMSFPQFQPGVGMKQDAAATEVLPASPGSTAEPAAGSALTAGTGMKASAPAAGAEALPNQPGAGWIQNLKADGAQKSGVGTDGVVPGTTDAAAAQPGAVPAGDAKVLGISAAALASADSAAEAPVQLPANAFSKSTPATDAKAEAVAAAQPDTHGTAAAKLYSAMNKTEKTTKVADTAEKVLPSNADLAAKENFLPANSPLHGSFTKDAVVVDAAASASGVSASAMADMRSRALERTHDMVALHAIRLGDAKTDTLHVVIKPGAGLQLSLDLRQRGEGIEAQMNLERGDFGALNQHWPELQQRLEERGIRLAPLTGSENSISDGSTSGFQQSQHEFANQNSDEAGAFAEFALVKSIVQPFTPAPVFATSGRSWETWA